MPGKSRHGRKKSSFQGKKKKGRRSSPPVFAQRQALTEAREPVVSPKVIAPAAKPSTPVSVPSIVQYPHVLTELRRIGILAGIMLVILVVLALVLA